MKRTLREKKIEAIFEFGKEFRSEGQLGKLYEDVRANLPYSVHKFHEQVLILNMAFTLT